MTLRRYADEDAGDELQLNLQADEHQQRAVKDFLRHIAVFLGRDSGRMVFSPADVQNVGDVGDCGQQQDHHDRFAALWRRLSASSEFRDFPLIKVLARATGANSHDDVGDAVGDTELQFKHRSFQEALLADAIAIGMERTLWFTSRHVDSRVGADHPASRERRAGAVLNFLANPQWENTCRIGGAKLGARLPQHDLQTVTKLPPKGCPTFFPRGWQALRDCRSLDQLRKVTAITAHGYKIGGVIPPGINTDQSLQKLRMSGCQLHGKIPGVVFHHNLTYVGLQGNELTGTYVAFHSAVRCGAVRCGAVRCVAFSSACTALYPALDLCNV